MKCLLRIGWVGLVVASSLLFVMTATLRVRSNLRSDVFMIPTGGQSAILIMSHRGLSRNEVGWAELTFLGKWPDPRLGWWSGRDMKGVRAILQQNNVGPFLIHAHRPASFPGTYSIWERIGMYIPWDRSGTFMVPLVSANGPVAYEDAYLRAEALGFPNSMPMPPQTVWVTGRQLRFPMAPILVIAAILPAIFLVSRTGQALRRRLGKLQPICATCRYDLRATLGRCPECGTVPPVIPVREQRQFDQAEIPAREQTRGQKIRRRVSRGLAITSALLCVCTAILWLRSNLSLDTYTRCARLDRSGAISIVRDEVSCGRGDLALGRIRLDSASTLANSAWGAPEWALFTRDRGWRSANPRSPDVVVELGLDEPSLAPLHYLSRVTTDPGTTTVRTGHALIVPLWFALLATAAWPAWYFSAGFRRRYMILPPRCCANTRVRSAP